MVLRGCKRRIKSFMLSEAREDSMIDKQQLITTEASTSTPILPLLDMPVPIIYDILSRLPLMDILRCRCVCTTFLKLLRDPYFSKIHLAQAPTLRTNLILRENIGKWGALHFFALDHSESTLSSCSSNDDQNSRPSMSLGLPEISKRNSEFSFRTNALTLVGSCNGLFCFYSNPPSRPYYVICNPILGECIRLPQITPPSSLYTYDNHTGFFGYCLRAKRYKVISFMHLKLANYLNPMYSAKIVAHVHTLGSDSWIRVKDIPCPKRNSFDPLLNGSLHWITKSETPSELISSFDLESEKLKFLPPPPHFNLGYVNRVSWMNISVLRGCLCICYIYEDIEFDVWVMNEYGVKESWSKVFSIDMNFYCKLGVEDFHRPVKFFGNGDLWFVSSSGSLVSFSPHKRTFKELRSIGRFWGSELSAHDLSFVSLKDVVGEKNPDLQDLGIGSRGFMFDL